MAYVTPNSRIIVCHNVPMDSTYEHSVSFDSATAQINTLMTYKKYEFTPSTYQRQNRNACRVERKVEDLYDCNYLLFQNTTFGNKWFYAFITSVDYINDSVTEISYEIDELQTWLFDWNLLPSFVERQHAETDGIGENIKNEPIATGEYVLNDHGKVDSAMDELCLVIGYVKIEEGSSSGMIYDRVYSGLRFKIFNCEGSSTTDINNIYNNFLKDYMAQPDDVVCMYMCPKIFVHNGNIPDTGYDLTWNNTPMTRVKQNLLPITAGTTQLDGYTPKNNKMYTYPYNFFMVGNNNGDSLVLRYEFFRDLSVWLMLEMNITPPVVVKLYPEGYKGTDRSSGLVTSEENTFETLSLNNFPMCSWNADYFKAWLSQNAIPMGMHLATGIVSGGYKGMDLSGITNKISDNFRTLRHQLFGKPYSNANDRLQSLSGNSGGGGDTLASLYALNTISNDLSSMYHASMQADIVKGNINSGNVNIAHYMENFFMARMSVPYQIAKQIDDFFSKYGYAQNYIRIPNIKARSEWTYIKTVGCKINGSIPHDSEKIINSIFDSGVTWWRNIAHVGNYSYTNSPLNT